MTEISCEVCGKPIHPERLEAIPDTKHCVKCVEKHGPKRYIDPEDVCAKPSATARNGFARSD